MKNKILVLMAISLSVQMNIAESKRIQNDLVFVEVTQDDKGIDETITRAWFASNDLETLLGLASLASRGDEYGIAKITRQNALKGARYAAAKLENELEALQDLRDLATREQRRAIDGILLVANARISGFNNILVALSGGGELEGVTSCSSPWYWPFGCVGFKTACTGANGVWESWGGGVETCTTQPVNP